MILKLMPQRSDLAASYAATGEVLTVTVNGIADTFDFSTAPDGELNDFTSDVLPICPVLRAEKSCGEVTVWALGWYGPRPEQDMQHTPATDEAGEIIDYRPEPEADYATRLAEWQALTQEREIQL